MAFNHGLKPGDTITNEQLAKTFKCSKQGGMRRSLRTNTLVIISDHSRSIYEDKWEGDIFYYTGMGLRGHQDLNYAQNKTLSQSNENGVEVHLFEVFKPQQYTYIGQVKLVGKPFQEEQPDADGNLRKVWIFPLKVMNEVNISEELVIEKQKFKEKQAQRITDEELTERVKYSKKKIGTRQVSTKTYERDPYISEYARRRAKGICQLCEKPAPFKDKKGNPFLEIHHIIWLSKGGEDSIENTVALCPNCHRKMHTLNLKEDVEKLQNKISSS
ncbi:MAG: HNH endonuclease [Desulfotomaculum sp.]|nr:HNH endonuclease [Desulfotomaculum sp.]